MNKVAVTQAGDDVTRTVRRSVELIGGLNLGDAQEVILKPNICNSRNPHGMVNTDLRVIQAVINLIHEQGRSVTVVESDSISDDAETRAEKSGLLDLLDELDVPFLNLTHDSYMEHSVAGTRLRLPRTVLDAEYFINMPKLKTCAVTQVTLGVKNLFGVLQRSQKATLHSRLDEVLVFLASRMRCDLLVVDGLTCMEGDGPVRGRPVELGVIVAGRNIVSVDGVCCRLMGLNPCDVPHIHGAAGLGVGSYDDVEVVGDDWRGLVRRFEPSPRR